MASATIDIRIRDMQRFKLMVWELQQLHDDMRVGASPFADRLEGLIERFVIGDDDYEAEAVGPCIHDLPNAETDFFSTGSPPEKVRYDDGCVATLNDDGSWTFTQTVVDSGIRGIDDEGDPL